MACPSLANHFKTRATQLGSGESGQKASSALWLWSKRNQLTLQNITDKEFQKIVYVTGWFQIPGTRLMLKSRVVGLIRSGLGSQCLCASFYGQMTFVTRGWGSLLLSKGIEGSYIIRDQQEWPGVQGIVVPFLPWRRQNWWATRAPDYMTHSPIRETDPRVGHFSWESISPICYGSLPLSFLILGL